MKVYRRYRNALRARQALDEAVAWRRRSLLRAGFPPDLASDLATDVRLDLHAVLQLVDRGCPPELAIRILEPLPSEMGS
ncbi:hypothetical protein [Nocardioides panzhihuensis]|uniref:Uncharacterized protein n=1 Tax=Nocardioides panzhihuensis TaxID=860243 RepID=A0A7Z0IQG6_9ACTN|nr:hypothetical protein [Nocardioides panzhihuensis]NYI75816.1 hypothetical protein [Nocardioides panzhihuensis]